ncbi:predicted protein [Nematostella vectensis]|uniref:Uncharacterized protein n=1 Tax=Nematostella vectensis TaxID=45351 RepID=A7SD01_NEMVE|nr:predicted protein [Nematostella vectensis]|eukprot:XP_001630471.1 predicted protein [Nematostella vectensis]
MAVEEKSSSKDECYVISEIAAVTLDDSQLLALKLDSGNYLRFQPDTGAQCNVIPVHLFKQASTDVGLINVQPVKSSISAYGGSRLPVIGEVIVRVSRDGSKCKLNCKLVGSKDIRPILGRKACIGMNIIKYTDNDALNKPQTGSAPVYAVENKCQGQKCETKVSLYEKFPQAFADGVGLLEGQCHIKVDNAVNPAQHAPRRVPVATPTTAH